MVAIGNRIERQETSFNQVKKTTVVQVSGCGNNDVVGRKALPVKSKQLLLLERADRLLGAQNRLAQRMVFPEILGEDFVDEVIGIVLVHLDLFQYHAFFPNDVLGSKNRIQKHVTQDVNRNREVPMQ